MKETGKTDDVHGLGSKLNWTAATNWERKKRAEVGIMFYCISTS